MILTGDLGMLNPAWAGWCIRGEQLISPEAWAATPGEVRSIQMMRAQIQNYQLEQRIARRTLEALEEQPAPADLPAQLQK
jgi:hypothetical protein